MGEDHRKRSREARELIPGVVDGIDAAVIGAFQIALKLKIVRRVGEYEIDRLCRQFCHLGNAIPDEDAGGRAGL